MRRSINVIMLTLAGGILSPAASAMASTQLPAAPQPQGFGVRLVDVPLSEANDPRALHYIVDYLPNGTVIHRRILGRSSSWTRVHTTPVASATSTRPQVRL